MPQPKTLRSAAPADVTGSDPATQPAMDSLQNCLLVAMPGLNDPMFSRSVTYICEHNAEGAMGIVLNQPLSVNVSGLLKQLDIDFDDSADNARQPVCNGGPVSHDRGFVLHTPKEGYTSSVWLNDELMVTTSKDILSTLTCADAPEKFLLALGYAGWSAGQLEQEIADNSWLVIPTDNKIIFDVPYKEKWQSATEKLGIHSYQLSTQAGHA